MRNFIVNLFLSIISRISTKSLLLIWKRSSVGETLQRQNLQLLPLYLDQLANNARNKYLYTNDPVFKGSIMAYTYLKNEITKKNLQKLKRSWQKPKKSVKWKAEVISFLKS